MWLYHTYVLWYLSNRFFPMVVKVYQFPKSNLLQEALQAYFLLQNAEIITRTNVHVYINVCEHFLTPHSGLPWAVATCNAWRRRASRRCEWCHQRSGTRAGASTGTPHRGWSLMGTRGVAQDEILPTKIHNHTWVCLYLSLFVVICIFICSLHFPGLELFKELRQKLGRILDRFRISLRQNTFSESSEPGTLPSGLWGKNFRHFAPEIERKKSGGTLWQGTHSACIFCIVKLQANAPWGSLSKSLVPSNLQLEEMVAISIPKKPSAVQ